MTHGKTASVMQCLTLRLGETEMLMPLSLPWTISFVQYCLYLCLVIWGRISYYKSGRPWTGALLSLPPKSWIAAESPYLPNGTFINLFMHLHILSLRSWKFCQLSMSVLWIKHNSPVAGAVYGEFGSSVLYVPVVSPDLISTWSSYFLNTVLN